MKTIFRKLISSGLWISPIVFTLCILGARKFLPSIIHCWQGWAGCIVVALFPLLIVYGNKINRPSEEKAISGIEQARYPPINEKMLFDQPEGIIFGKFGKQYVCKSLKEDGHFFLCGGSGSGKSSSVVIPTLLANRQVSTFAIDIKGELSYKTAQAGDERVCIFDPSDRTSFGYDPFYSLNSDSTQQQILEVMQSISFSLIPMPAGLKDPFWKLSARNLLTGLLIFFYKNGNKDFIQIIDCILGKPIQDSIKEIMEDASPKSAEYRYIVQFSVMEEVTLGGILAEMNNHIVIFSNDQDIRYAFSNNYCKLNPSMLEEEKSIFLSVSEEKLSAYYDVLQLIINQTLAHLEKRSEKNARPVIVIIDELARILSAGKLDTLLDGARTLRSRKVCLCLITQSVESLMGAYSESEVTDLISNCSYIEILAATSPKTQKMVCDWCGKYLARKQNWTGTGSETKSTVSFEETDLVKPSDLMTLQQTGEAILISPYGYSRIQKTPYYSDKFFKPLSDEIIRHNDNIKPTKE